MALRLRQSDIREQNDFKFSKDQLRQSIPRTIFVTGEWMPNSSEVSKIQSNMNLAKAQTTLGQAAVNAKFAKWAPLGSLIKYFSDDDMEESVYKLSKMLKDRGVTDYAFSAYSNLSPGAYRADLWRYMVLWAEGGVYLDANLQLKEKLEEFIDFEKDELVLVKDEGASHMKQDGWRGAGYWNAIMAASPFNVYLEGVIKGVVERIRNHQYGRSPIDVTGPQALYQELEKQGPEYKKHLRCDLKFTPPIKHERYGHLENKKGKRLHTTKDNLLHHFWKDSVHYGYLWSNHLVYCDEQTSSTVTRLCRK